MTTTDTMIAALDQAMIEAQRLRDFLVDGLNIRVDVVDAIQAGEYEVAAKLTGMSIDWATDDAVEGRR